MLKQIDKGREILSYKIKGKGSTIVLIHGFGGDSRYLHLLSDFLQQQFQVILPDLRGSGQSNFKPGPNEEEEPTLTIESMAADIKKILDNEQISLCTMLGHSMGGYVTLAFADMYPHFLEAIGLIHSSAYADGSEKLNARQKNIKFIEENGSAPFLKTMLPNLFASTFKLEHADMVETLIEQAKYFTKDALIGYNRAMMKRPDRSHVLKNSRVPVLFIIGEEDQAVSPADALEQSSFPAVAQVEMIKGIAHMGMLEAPEQVQLAVSDFLKLVAGYSQKESNI
jgi:pimeloyl-ACP methyl ester carboxylesterase